LGTPLPLQPYLEPQRPANDGGTKGKKRRIGAVSGLTRNEIEKKFTQKDHQAQLKEAEHKIA
jgi:hypothetical protein